MLVLAKGLLHRRHLVGELLPVRAGEDRRQRQIGLQLASCYRRPVEGADLHPFGHEVIGIGVGQPLAAQQQLFAIGAECLRQVVARVAGEPHHLAAAGGHHEHILVAIEVGGKGDQLAIRRPDGALAQVAAAGKGAGRPPCALVMKIRPCQVKASCLPSGERAGSRNQSASAA